MDVDERRKKSAVQKREASRGQGMLEYVLVLAVVVTITFTGMQVISSSASSAVNALVNNIQNVTGVSNTAN